MEDVQVFYSFTIYNDGKPVSYGSGSMIGNKIEIWNDVMGSIAKSQNCTYQDIHLIAFNTI